ncbi:ice-binding family protein [uncultured Jatrophihabitans sp.]|uniref:ice-binding family protein n=1 Tax=uncultured Jatrophihabitans sp. TaxID=1610747 RepID=UPI0035CB36F3
MGFPTPSQSTAASAGSTRRPAFRRLAGTLAATTSVALLIAFGTAGSAAAAGAQVDLGTVAAYSVLGGQTVTNTGPSRLNNDLGVSPGTAITGFPPGRTAGATHAADAPAEQAQSDLTIAYNDAAGRAKTASVAGDLVGRTLTSGVYNSTGPLSLSGTLTLNGQGDPNAVFIFQVASTLITASASYINMINGAQACNVFWQVGSSATLGTASVFRGSILALTSISVTTDTVVQGRALARNGAVTLDNDTFTSPACGTTVEATPSTTTASVTPSTTATGGTATVTATVTGAGSPTGTVVFTSGGTQVGSAPVDSTGHATVTIPAGDRAGTKTITATYTGSTTLLPSTSRPTSLTVRAAPSSGSSTSPGSPGVTGGGTSPGTPSPSATSPLASTGTTHLAALISAAVALMALGGVLSWTGRGRRRAHHRR